MKYRSLYKTEYPKDNKHLQNRLINSVSEEIVDASSRTIKRGFSWDSFVTKSKKIAMILYVVAFILLLLFSKESKVGSVAGMFLICGAVCLYYWKLFIVLAIACLLFILFLLFYARTQYCY